MIPVEMQYSKSGLELTKEFESCRLLAYQDDGGVWTIGYGHTDTVHPGMTCTMSQAVGWLMHDIAWATATVNMVVNFQPSQPEFDSLVDFCFNVGPTNFRNSHLLQYVNARQWAQAANEFEKWSKCNGNVLAGLLRRRINEESLYAQSHREELSKVDSDLKNNEGV